jgi:hypothetical protein
METIKTLYTFTLDKEIEVEKTEQIDSGTLTKKVKETKTFEFALRKPTRSIADANELFYSVQFNEAIKAGLIPSALLAKRFNNDNGVLSEAQFKDKQALYDELREVANNLTQHLQKKEEEHTEEEKKTATEWIEKYNLLQKKINAYESAEQSLFDNTAENRARMKALTWYALFLSYKKNDKGEFEPIYPGKTFDEKLKSYDELIEEKADELYIRASQKFSWLVTAMYLGKASTPEDFKALDEQISGGSFNDPNPKTE